MQYQTCFKLFTAVFNVDLPLLNNFETCVFCGNTFSDKENIEIYILKNHSENIPEQRCQITDCKNTAHNYFSSIKLSSKNTPPHKNIFICDTCITRFVPPQELKQHPPVRC